MAFCAPGLLALTAFVLTGCASPPPVKAPLALAIPASVSSPCARSERPSLPPPGALDSAKPEAGDDGRFDAGVVAPLWSAFVARGRWIVKQSEFSLAQEGDVAACDAARGAAVEILEAVASEGGAAE